VRVDVVPRYEKSGSARTRNFMARNMHGFDSLEDAANAVAEYLPHRTKPRSPEGLKKNLRERDGRGTGTGIRRSSPSPAMIRSSAPRSWSGPQ
jgi:hypothetical protein